MWKLYEDLLASVAEDTSGIRDFTVGPEWCAVLAEDGTIGLSRVQAELWQRQPFQIDFRPGMRLKEAVPAVRSWNPLEAALGLASLNAYFNKPENLPADAVLYPSGRRSRGVFMQFCEEHTKGKKTLMIEPAYNRDELSAVPGVIDVIRMVPEDRDYRFNAWEDRLPEADSVVLSGAAFREKLAPPIAAGAVAAGKELLAWGPEMPIAPVLAKYGFVQITGFIVDDPEKCLWLVKRAANRDELLRTGHFADTFYQK